MREMRSVIGAALAGAGLMYLLDPDRGRRRRARLRDRFAHARRTIDTATDKTGRDLANRMRGAVAGARTRMRRGSVDDDVLTERVRTRIGRLVSHPHAIDVTARAGRVTLAGPVLAHEEEDLLSGARSVPGVREVESRLELHETPGTVPGLQGEPGRRREMRPEFLQEYWAPAARFVGGLAGAGLALLGGRLQRPLGWAARIAGLGLLARSATNMQLKRLTGVSAGRRGVDVQKSINIAAPVSDVFEFWSHFDNFPRFMSHLREVRRTDERVSHWVANGPAGAAAQWDAEITEWVPDEVIRWRSLAGSPVENAGWVRFQPNETGGTRIDVHMSYNPPAGAAGHVVASLFGTDPKRAMDEDLVRMKTLLEEGRTSVHGRRIEHRGDGRGARAADGAARAD